MKGSYVLTNRVLTKHEKEKGKLIKPDGWTINLDEVPMDILIRDVDTIRFITEARTYTISREKALLKGFQRDKGSENKWIIPMFNFDKSDG